VSRLAVRLGGWVCSERGSFGILKLMIMTFVFSCLLWAVDLGFQTLLLLSQQMGGVHAVV